MSDRRQSSFFAHLILPLVAAIVGCHGPEERPAPAAAPAVEQAARPVPVRGGRMQLDDALALCLCSFDGGACNGNKDFC
jgi:hypothetical protein